MSTSSSKNWQLQDAKSHLNKVVEAADNGAAQFITVEGKQVAVVLSTGEYQRLIKSSGSLSSALLMPVLGDGEDAIFERNKDTGRSLDL